MEITKTIQDKTLIIKLAGRLDTVTSPSLEKVVAENLANIDSLKMDFEKLEYISSAGLRVLLLAQKSLTNGEMTIVNVNESIREVFDITGFVDILKIE